MRSTQHPRGRQVDPDGPFIFVENVQAPDQAPEGSDIAATATVRNSAGDCAEFDVVWLADGSELGRDEITDTACLGAGHTSDYTRSTGPMPGGTNELCAEIRNIVIGGSHQTGNQPSMCTTVGGTTIDPTQISVTDCVASAQIDQGAQATANVTVQNGNQIAANATISLTADGQEIARNSFALPPDGVADVPLQGGASLSPGQYDLSATVVSATPLAAEARYR